MILFINEFHILPTKSVFKKNDESDSIIIFKTRDVILAYMMISGADYTERFFLVVTDEALQQHIFITLAFYSLGWSTISCNIEAAFLEPTMDVEMFIEYHPSMVVCVFMTKEERKESEN